MRSDARKRPEPTGEPCETCGYPSDSFACKIRHIALDTSWAKGDH